MWSKIVLAIISFGTTFLGRKESSKTKAEAKMISYQADAIFMDNYERIILLLEKRIANDALIIEKLEMVTKQDRKEILALRAQNRELESEIILLKSKIKKQDNG